MSGPVLCPKCGGQLPEDAPAGLCPKCLVQCGLESESQGKPSIERTGSAALSHGFEPPSVEALARQFPQIEVLELLGKGGMGAVYKARQKELDRLVALKILPPEVARAPAFAERFTREARALARLSHPNIVAVYDFGRTSDGLFYFSMEYVDGINLRQAIRSGGMAPKQALAIVPQICDALQFAHDEGIVHRDIKPENILVDKRGRVKIADFGLAKLLGHAPGDVSLTGTQQVMGTPRYMAPEQIEGTKAVDHRADIYSLGVVFYELLTGELPIGRFAPPSKKVAIDVRLDEVVLRALEKEPEQRYQHASEVRTDVEAVRDKSPGYEPTLSGNVAVEPAPNLAGAAQVLITMGGLTITSAVFTFLLFIGAIINTYSFDQFFRNDAVAVPLVILQTLAIPAGIMMVIAGLSPRLRSRSWSRFVAILGLVPLTPAWLLTLPLGIWVLTVLQPETHGASAHVQFQREGRPPLSNTASLGNGLLEHAASKRQAVLWLLVSLNVAAAILLFALMPRPQGWSYSVRDHGWIWERPFKSTLYLDVLPWMFSLQSLFLLACVLSSLGIYRFALTILSVDQYVVPPLSRKALVGVLWAAWFPAACTLAALLACELVPAIEEGGFLLREWGLRGAFTTVAILPGLLAPIGTTVLGAMALRDMHRRPAHTRGLALAVADVLLFPLLAVNACLTGLMLLADPPAGVSMAEWLGGSMAICLVLDVLVVRWMWRKSQRIRPGQT